ncbi:Ankyrin-2 [Dactylella cylindrospora]|nr:Ankyrin-2 [Dactylella cylindrospora]
MAPLGLLTAVVSVIRVCGSASLRAFIGRAQEGPGIAEQELLSCTSETTAEIYNEGGIARVFGEPQILEMVVMSTDDQNDPLSKLRGPVISMMWDALREWNAAASDGRPEQHPYVAYAGDGTRLRDVSRYHRPNLSLNVGIVRLPPVFTYMAAMFGITLQTGILIFAALTVYKYPQSFLTAEDTPAENYAFVLTFCGTIFVCFGLFLCAFIIERSTDEVHFKRNSEGGLKSRIFWIQPGGQKIGDQVFGSYIGFYDGTEYIRSTKSEREMLSGLWVAVVTTVIGFIAQFVGLRAMHASVTLAQLGATILMSIIRAMLRTQRMDKTGNIISALRKPEFPRDAREQHPFVRDPKLLYGFELDLFAAHIHKTEGFFVVPNLSGGLRRANRYYPEDGNIADTLLDARAKLAEYTGMRGRFHRESLSWEDLEVRKHAYQLQAAMEEAMKVISNMLGPMITGSAAYEEDDWSIDVYVSGLEDGVLSGPHRLNLYVLKGNSLSWRFPRAPLQLEALLGLWGMTMSVSHANQLHYTGDSAARVYTSIRMIHASPADELWREQLVETVYCKPWIQRQREAKRQHITGAEAGYMTHWSRDGKPNHIFGSLNPPNPGEELVMTYLNPDKPTLKMCTQDLFMFFLRAILMNYDNIGGETEFRSAADYQSGDPGIGLSLQNSTVEALADCFESNELGSREDAYMCIFPVLMNMNKMPKLEDTLDAILTRSFHFRTLDQWKAAEEWLEATVKLEPSLKINERDVAAFGWMYCTAIDAAHEDMSDWGVDGLCKLVKASPESPVSQAYGQTGLRLVRIRSDRVRARENDLLVIGVYDYDLPFDPTNIGDPRGLRLLDWAKIDGFSAFKYRIKYDHTFPLRTWNLGIENKNELGMALCYAARQKRLDFAEFLLQRTVRANIFFYDDDDRTAFSYAAEVGFHQLMELLLEEDPYGDESSQGSVSSQPHVSTRNDQWKRERRAMILRPSRREGKIPLMYAAEAGYPECVKLLLAENPKQFKERDHNGDSAMKLAANKNQGGQTPLDFAAAAGHVSTIKILMAKGATISEAGVRSAVHSAAREGKLEVVKYLLEIPSSMKGETRIDINHLVGEKRSALHEALCGGHEQVVTYLVQRGIDVNLKDEFGIGAVHIASEDGNEALLKPLLISRLRINETDQEGATALHRAAKGGHAAIVQLLLGKGAGVNLKDADGNAPIHLALQAGRNYENVIGLLLSHGADIKYKNAAGKTVVEEAQEKGLLDIKTQLDEEEKRREEKTKANIKS